MALCLPWWQCYLDAAEAEPGGRRATELKDIKQAVYEYMLAYFETGAAKDEVRPDLTKIGLTKTGLTKTDLRRTCLTSGALKRSAQSASEVAVNFKAGLVGD